jgi:hypothetical protein
MHKKLESLKGEKFAVSENEMLQVTGGYASITSTWTETDTCLPSGGSVCDYTHTDSCIEL